MSNDFYSNNTETITQNLHDIIQNNTQIQPTLSPLFQHILPKLNTRSYIKNKPTILQKKLIKFGIFPTHIPHKNRHNMLGTYFTQIELRNFINFILNYYQSSYLSNNEWIEILLIRGHCDSTFSQRKDPTLRNIITNSIHNSVLDQRFDNYKTQYNLTDQQICLICYVVFDTPEVFSQRQLNNDSIHINVLNQYFIDHISSIHTIIHQFSNIQDPNNTIYSNFIQKLLFDYLNNVSNNLVGDDFPISLFTFNCLNILFHNVYVVVSHYIDSHIKTYLQQNNIMIPNHDMDIILFKSQMRHYIGSTIFTKQLMTPTLIHQECHKYFYVTNNKNANLEKELETSKLIILESQEPMETNELSFEFLQFDPSLSEDQIEELKIALHEIYSQDSIMTTKNQAYAHFMYNTNSTLLQAKQYLERHEYDISKAIDDYSDSKIIVAKSIPNSRYQKSSAFPNNPDILTVDSPLTVDQNNNITLNPQNFTDPYTSQPLDINQINVSITNDSIVYLNSQTINHQNIAQRSDDSQTDADGSKTEADGSQTEADSSQTEADGSQTEADGSQTEADGSQTETDGSQMDTDPTEEDGVSDDSEGYYEIEKIVGHKRQKGKILFLVKWVDSNVKTYEPTSNFLGKTAIEILNIYKLEHGINL